MSKLLIDTNIFIYDIDRSSKFHMEANHVDSEIILNYYQDIKNNTEILCPDYESMEIFEIMYEKYKVKGNRIYDLEVVSLMIRNNISEIATKNVRDFIDIEEISIREKIE